MKSGNTTAFLISAILTIVLTSLFLVVTITPLYVVAYFIALFGIWCSLLGKLYMISQARNFPWFAAFPITVYRYLFSQLILSAVFVIAEQTAGFSIPLGWFIFMHIVLAAFFAIILLVMNKGKGIIETRGAEVKQKVATLRLMQADVESLMRSLPEHEQDLKRVAEALRYSDPMSHSSLAIYEEQIERAILEMQNGGENIPAQCERLLRQIADRNARGKVLK